MITINRTKEWQSLAAHQQEISQCKLTDLFKHDEQRFNKFSLRAAGILLDYSKNFISELTLSLLVKLAEQTKLTQQISGLFQGHIVNTSENQPALHTLLRRPVEKKFILHQHNIMTDIAACQQTMTKLYNQCHQYTDVVNIGIGGSDLGPRMVVQALKPYHTTDLKFHYLANIDPQARHDVLQAVNPHKTLFIVASKSFSTPETIENFYQVKRYLKQKNLSADFWAITAKPQRAIEFGIATENILPIWNWVGGRYSIWSAIGLSVFLAIGPEQFNQFLAGAYAMDQHFQTAELLENMPVIMAMLGIWYNNFFSAQSHCVLPYHQGLAEFPAYLQQLDMESNGKSIQKNGKPLDYHTCPLTWGSTGSNCQHAFSQLLHQGTHWTPIDFIVAKKSFNGDKVGQQLLIANCLSQSQALMQGKSLTQAQQQLSLQGLSTTEIADLAPHKVIAGNRPSNTLLLDKLTPENLAALIVLYEHKTFVQSVIWNINAFDQWGVELGKSLSKNLLPYLMEANRPLTEDASTNGLLEACRNC